MSDGQSGSSLIKEGEKLGSSIKRMTVGYVQLHNNKYGRTGHLFQNRFNSEAVEGDQYLMTVLLYSQESLKSGNDQLIGRVSVE